MKSYNIKCIGCGNFLNDQQDSFGYVPNYVPNKTKYCQRCYQLKHYGKVINSQDTIQQVDNKLSQLDLSGSFAFVVLDVLNIPLNLIDKSILNQAERIYFIINKMDCLPKKFNFDITQEYIKKTINNFGFNNYELVYTSIKNKSSIKRLWNQIKAIPKNKKIYLIGKTNAGKSSLLNELLKINNLKSTLSVSPYINTTLDFKKIIINQIQIIDTPGFTDPDNILNFVNNADSKSIVAINGINPRNYFLDEKQSLLIEKLAIFTHFSGNKSNFTIYLSKNLKILRCKANKANDNLENKLITGITYLEPDWVEHHFLLDPERKYNLHINGLCMISINQGVKAISIKTHKKVKVYLNENAII